MFNTNKIIWATTRQNVSSGVSDQAKYKLAYAATKASLSLEISAIESRDIILSKQRTTKALIRLRRCAGWSAPLLVASDKRHIFSWLGSFVFVRGVYMDICLFSKCTFYCNTDLLYGEYVFNAKYLLIFFAIHLKYICVCYCILMDHMTFCHQFIQTC